MKLRNDNLLIRYATKNDAAILCKWWNDGKIMAHAGFPNGINTSEFFIIYKYRRQGIGKYELITNAPETRYEDGTIGHILLFET